jgi:RNA polymerase-binding transcription factor DksA
VTSNDGPRARLEARQQAARARVAGLERDFAAIVEATSAANIDDEHDPEGATIAFERQHVAALLDQARDELEQAAGALRRLDDDTYGRCERCGRPIPQARLAARPATTTCVQCAAASNRRRR